MWVVRNGDGASDRSSDVCMVDDGAVWKCGAVNEGEMRKNNCYNMNDSDVELIITLTFLILYISCNIS